MIISEGKTYIKKNSTLKLVLESIHDNYVTFTNGAKCKKETLMTDFVEEIINPDDFFDESKNLQRMKNEAVYTNTAPRDESMPVYTPPVAQPNYVPNNTNYKPAQTFKAIEEPIPTEFDTAPIITPGNDNQPTVVYQPVPQPSESTEALFFKKLKRQINYNINLDIPTVLPKKEQLALINDMFEMSASEYFALEIVNNLLQNKKALIDNVANQIELYITGEKVKKIKQPKVAKVIEPIIVPEPEPIKKVKTKRIKKNEHKSADNTIDNNITEEASGSLAKDGVEETNVTSIS